MKRRDFLVIGADTGVGTMKLETLKINKLTV